MCNSRKKVAKLVWTVRALQSCIAVAIRHPRRHRRDLRVLLRAHHDAKYINPVVVGLVTAMGVGRIADRGHWLTNQTVSVAFGYAVGRHVARRQLTRVEREKKGETSSIPPVSEPFMGASASGLVTGWRRSFPPRLGVVLSAA
jgi:RNase P protein component